VYAVDTGLVNAITFRYSQDRGYLLENAVFIQLKRLFEKVFFLRNKVECDFFIRDKDSTRVMQVCYSLEDEGTRRREVKGLMQAMNRFGLQEGAILTAGAEETFIVEGKTIQTMPAWKALLQMENDYGKTTGI
jgi:predicted AAA+ superfamily ATPase